MADRRSENRAAAEGHPLPHGERAGRARLYVGASRSRLPVFGAALAFALTLLWGPPALAAERIVLPVAAIVIYPGDTIGEDQLTDRDFPAAASGIDGMIDDYGRLVGMVARRTLLPGRPIPINAVKEPDLVTRGVPVQLVYDSDGLMITAVATPLQSGGLGDIVRVRNVDSGIVVTGTVEGDGRVRVGLR